MKDEKTCYKPGEEVPASGIYINPVTGEKTTCVKGEPFPPTFEENQCWILHIPTHDEQLILAHSPLPFHLFIRFDEPS